MTDFDDGLVLEAPVLAVETDPLDAAIHSAIAGEVLDLRAVPGAHGIGWDDVIADVARFSAQCNLLARLGDFHPCVRIDRSFVPVDILASFTAAGGSQNAVDLELLLRVTRERLESLSASGLDTRLAPIDEVKSTFMNELKKFIRRRIESFFGNTPRDPGDDGFRGLKVVVSALTPQRLVVQCNSFFFRDEQPFGEGLTSPVVGYLPNAGYYYFGLLDGTTDRAAWSSLTYEVPPNLSISLQL